jgi:poly-gamma-glutamate capsule biosynthesis protein CapA/YwtB (metallophosphatase superfamily)
MYRLTESQGWSLQRPTLGTLIMQPTAKATLAALLGCLLMRAVTSGETGQTPPHAGDTLTLSGRLADDNGGPLTAGRLTVNGKTSVPVVDGAYSLSVDRADVYEILYEGQGAYPFLHTWDDGEVADLKGKLPPVELVARKPGRMLLMFGGDTMMGRRFYQPNPGEPQWIRRGHELEDGQALLRHIKPYLELADFASVNLESQLIADEPPAKAEKAYTFYSHPATLGALAWAGVDYVALGNNHMYDYLEPGLESTLAAFNQFPLAHSGAGMNVEQALTAHHAEVAGNQLSLLSFVGWKGRSNPSQVADDAAGKGGAAHGTRPNIVATVDREAAEREAAEREAADRVVIVQYHGGTEYADEPTDLVRARLEAAIDHGADLVIGHHPHVLQGIEVYKDKLIAYSMGNFLFDQYRQETQNSALLYVWMDGPEFHRAEIVPIYVKDYHTVPATGAMRDYVLRRLAGQSADYGTSLSVSGGHAVIRAPGSPRDEPLADSSPGKSLELDGEAPLRLPAQWVERPLAVLPPQHEAAYRLGRDLLLCGDYEQQGLFGLEDANWSFTNPASRVTDSTARSGRHSLELAPAAGSKPSLAEQRYFMRVFDADKPLTLVGYATSTGPAELSACLDTWPTGVSLARAEKSHSGTCSAKIPVTKGRWTQFAVEVPPLGARVTGIRVRLQNEGTSSGPAASIFVDDLALVAWQTDELQLDPRGQLILDNECNFIDLSSRLPRDRSSRLETVEPARQTAN